jgi:hypothetical protein
MFPIKINVSAASLADVLGEMREWLDLNHLHLSRFGYTKDGPGGAIIQVQFEDRDQAELFRARFEPRI